MKNKKNKTYTKKIGIFIIITIACLIFGLLLYVKLVPIYSIHDRKQSLAKKMDEDESVVGWLKVQGTNIDYPVVFSGSSKFQSGEYDYDYLWSNDSTLLVNARAIIWGHNIRNVSSKPLLNEPSFNYLENLPSFLYYDFVKDNKYIQYTMNGKNYIYKIFAVQMVEKEKFSNDEYMTKEQRKEYIEKAKKDSYFNFDTEVDPNKKIITVATCTRFFGETTTILKVDGIMVGKNEKLTNYKVKKNKSYTEIEKAMKGDVEYETDEA